ncbi:hypothetical protein HNP24_001754 [Chryseobacterium sediminis]|uniref:YD repeat-containing protein n=1 Tax=Chryseobacterium sediminis TaxID=1679494 RepID=A0ABR6PZ11_9FLAO|nr:hypothetical protein [Chryseobacterium sediminis]MBB6330804.1 hypothetical protein [Chryseobacterium sediminis]
MKRLYSFILLIMLIGFSFQLQGQGLNFKPINIKSPESYSYERMGNIPINMNRGTIDFNIPLLDINIDGLNSSISLGYDSSGFIPTKKSGFAGLNWSINASGAITREVRGIPDDFTTIQSGSLNGFLSAIAYNKSANDIYTKNFQLSSGISTPWPGIFNGSISSELESDKYNFNFLGISGYFTLSNDGTPLIRSNDPNLVVDISGYSQQWVAEQTNCKPEMSSFKIIDGNGNKYYFGGRYDNLELSSDLGNYQTNQGAYIGDADFTITSWYLNKVELSNGRTIKYTYNEDDPIGAGSNYCTQKNAMPHLTNANSFNFSFDINRYFYQEAQNTTAQYDYSWAGYSVSGSSQSSTWQSPYIRINLTKKAMLKEINVDNLYTIFFTYDTYNDDLGYKSYKLKKIEEKYQNNITKTIDFTISPKGTSKRRWLLTALKINNKDYGFEYYKDTSFPDDATRGVDYWGYYNGKPETNMMIPDYKFYANTGDTEILSNNRNVDSNFNDIGLLKKVIYPTKGYTEFFYEPNTFSSRLMRNSATAFFPQIGNETGIASGMRIQKMIDNADNIMPIVKTYKYTKDLNSIESSGILKSLYNFVDYIEYKQSAPGGYTLKKELKQTGSNIELQAYSSSNIEYSNVFEYVDGQVQKQHTFSTYKTNPDILNSNNYFVQIHIPQFNYDHTLQDYLKNKETDLEDRSFARGKLIQEDYYKDNTVIKTVKMNYGFIDKDYCKNFSKNNILTLNCRNVNQDYTTRVKKISNAWELFQKEFVKPYALISSQIEEKNIGGNLITKNGYVYDDISYLNNNKINTTFSDGKIVSTEKKFAQSLNKPALINLNMTGISLQEITSQTVGVANNFLSKIENVYPDSLPTIQGGNLMVPLSILSYDLQNIATSRTEIFYDKYDPKGNLQQFTTKDGLSTVIIWGYNLTQPIAKIEGAKLTDIQQSLIDPIVTASNTDASAAANNDETSLLSVLNTFRNSLPNYQITTYTYDPLIGVRSITPPTGISEIYIYDSANRLKEIREKSYTGNLLKEFKYNYKQ